MKTKTVVVFAALALCAAQSFAETHTVTFRRMNGTVLSKVEVAHGANATSLVPAGPDILSRNKVSFKLGRCEIRAKLTNVMGANTAFWMMGDGLSPCRCRKSLVDIVKRRC